MRVSARVKDRDSVFRLGLVLQHTHLQDLEWVRVTVWIGVRVTVTVWIRG